METSSELNGSFEQISKRVNDVSEINMVVSTASEEQRAVTHEISLQLENLTALVQSNVERIQVALDFNEVAEEQTEALKSELSFFDVK